MEYTFYMNCNIQSLARELNDNEWVTDVITNIKYKRRIEIVATHADFIVLKVSSHDVLRELDKKWIQNYEWDLYSYRKSEY